MLKKIVLLMLFTISIVANAQMEKGFSISLSSGITTPTGDYQKYSKKGYVDEQAIPIKFYGFTKEHTGKMQYNLDASYQFGSLGAGISLGQFTHESGLSFEINFPFSSSGGDIKGLYYGIGPNYSLALGKFKMISMVRAGMMNLDITDFTGSYNGDDTDNPIQIMQTSLNPKGTTSVAYSSVGLQLSYPVSNKISIFSKLDYFTSFGEGVQVDDSYYLPFDVDRNDIIDALDVGHFTLEDYLQTEHRFIKPQMFNVGVGIRFNLSPGKPKKSSIKDPVKQQTKKPDRDDTEKKDRKIVLKKPVNGAQFGEKKELKSFNWTVIGKAFKNPNYIIEVKSKKHNGPIFIGHSKETSISAKEIFKDTKPSGAYNWRVVEEGTGEGSGMATFYYNDCDVDMQITNVNIECLGYEGADRKYQICFDVTYTSPIGDLTYNNAGSGLSVFDQNYNNLSYNLTGNNTSLQTQTGASTTTVNYCFETTVDTTVTQIGFGIQGDDLDPTPIICQPGASNGVDELPNCLCDECDQIEINLDGISINTNTQNPSVFSFGGNVSVNVPIYGIEFQVLSISYNSNPGSCTNGVTGVETSGVFLQSGTTINNSSSIQFLNENASTSGTSNDNVSRNIIYTSSNAMNGNIPIYLNIGLPQPLQDLDAGCCTIDYEVCLKVKVFYEDGSCKTCYTTQCFNFNNQ